MVLKILYATVNAVLPQEYYLHAAISIAVILAVRAFAQGRKTDRDRDLHARVVIVTGAFTPFGLTLCQELAKRGAHIIALTPDPITSPRLEILVDLLRTSTSNEKIYAEQCDLASPSSVRAFCNKFLTGQETRLDALIFAHEYQHIGRVFSKRNVADKQERDERSLATFLMITLLLPVFLVAPVERDIRIINVVNPFYAAAAPFFSATLSQNSFAYPQLRDSIFLGEGARALRSAVFTRHLQRILDALPNRAQPPRTNDATTTVPVVDEKAQRSNIVAVSVSPGISRSDTVAPLLGADRSLPTFSVLGLIYYILAQPLLRILVKSPTSALQSVLHTLFLPTPFKIHASSDTADEVLKPGALYSDCSVVRVPITVPPRPATDSASEKREDAESKRDDGELGGERAGQMIWEFFEARLKEWEAANPAPPEVPKTSTPPASDPPETDPTSSVY